MRHSRADWRAELWLDDGKRYRDIANLKQIQYAKVTSKMGEMEHRAVLSSKGELHLDMWFLLPVAKSENAETPTANDGVY